MRERMERFVLLPFAVGCMSESSIGVASPQSRRPRNEETDRHRSEEETLSDECSKSSSWNSLSLPKPNLSVSMDRLFKGFKTFSHLFVYKEEDEEEEETEIEIGLPTDVKHVTHIGWDGCAGVTNYPIIKGGSNNWDTLDFLHNNSDHHQRLQLLSKFNDHHHQLPDTKSDNPDHHHLIADQVSKEIVSIPGGAYS